MAANNEYAQLATYVYVRPDANRTVLNGVGQIARREGDGWGFSASAYQRG